LLVLRTEFGRRCAYPVFDPDFGLLRKRCGFSVMTRSVLFHKEIAHMKKRIAVGTFVALCLVAGTVLAAEALKSGPQVGKDVPGPFHPVNINGEKAGERFCLYCVNGTNPVAMVFARDVSQPVTTLIKKIDAANEKYADKKMGSFVVFLNNDSEELTGKLKQVAEKQHLKHTILALDNQAGPKNYNVAQEADVTVVLYTDHNVKANYAFKKGELNAKAIDKIIADLPKILPQD